MNILFVLTGLDMGGAERQVADLADELARRGHGISITYLTGDVLVRPRSSNVGIYPIGMRKTPGGFIRGLLELRRLVRQLAPDVVHSHMVHANIVSRLVRLTTPMRYLISSAHNTNEGGRARMWAYRLTHALSDLTTNVSDDAVVAFEAKGAVPRGTMVEVPNGIDTDRFRHDPDAGLALRAHEGVAPDTKIILAVGRLVPEKDHARLLQAYASIAAQHDVQLWIVGQGPLLGSLQASAAALGITEKVRFLGLRHDIQTLMNAADVFVLSSLFEGFGLVVAEAMACERVVVATDSGGVRDVLGDCGYLVPPGDTAALQHGLAMALDLTPGDAQALGQRARARVVARYSLSAAADRWLDIYKTAVKT